MSVVDRLLTESIRAASHHGVEISQGVLCLPAGLDPERVRKLTSALRGEPFTQCDPAMMWFMELAGTRKDLRDFIDCFIDDGTLDFIKGFERLTWMQRLKIGVLGYQALGVFELLRDYVVANMRPSPRGIKTLEDAVVALRDHVAEKMDCDSDWDAILHPSRSVVLTDLGRQWNVGN